MDITEASSEFKRNLNDWLNQSGSNPLELNGNCLTLTHLMKSLQLLIIIPRWTLFFVVGSTDCALKCGNQVYPSRAELGDPTGFPLQM